MQVINHRLEGVPYDAAHTIGGTIDPKFIVMHYTAGYTMKSAVDTFKNSVIAAQITIDRDGSAIQMAPLNKKCNHAGPSEWMGVKMLNGHSIGIEFVNIGFAKMQGNGRLVDSYGKVVNVNEAEQYIEAPNARIGSGRIFWQPYTEAQIAKGIEITKAILSAYSIRDIVSHEEIDTRGWKTDPGPAFPMHRFGALMRGVENVASDEPLKGMTGTVTTASLNIRGGAGTNYPVIGVTKSGSRLGIIEFKDGFYRVHTSLGGVDSTGWVSAQFVSVL